MENTLFNQHRMDKYAKDKSFKIKPSQYDLIKKHMEKLEMGELKAETSNYLYFFDVFLRDILGYEREENVLFDETVDKGAKRSEFVLKNNDEKFMIVELKGQFIELDKPQQGHGGKTPVKQAMDYSYDTNSANWVIVSNYDEFRLYNYHEKNHYISFKVEELLDPKIFSYFMLVFSKKSHIGHEYPQTLLDDTLVVDKELEKNFYNLFHETRLMLVKELEYGGYNREKAIEHAQTILNRYIFICFAEDTKGLLPEEISIKTIINPLKEGIVGKNKIWARLNELFSDMDTGDRVGINQFNGKLFCKDLSSLPIRDLVEDPKFFEETWQKYDFEGYSKDIKPLIKSYEKNLNPIYKNLLLMSTFDFSSQLDVNIMGHIFENSIGDIEDLKEGFKGRRKKEGIFYTPNYITDYISRNTIIPYLSKTGNAESIETLIDEYSGRDEIEELESKVMNIKILDPACGSGAFLNKASDILLKIHKSIYDFKKMKYTAKIETKGGKGKDKVKRTATHSKLDSYFNEATTRREILINNIYGVDLNEESVDITKLAFFLKVAQKEKKLPDLDKNIKCGNSLIDDPEYAGKKAFNWKKEFPEICENGGFDIVIGNPPYVNIIKISKLQLPYLKKNYKSASYGRIDLYLLFIEKSLLLLKEYGFTSFIIPDKFVTHKYASILRKIILKTCHIGKLVDLRGFKIFSDAVVENIVYVLKKEEANSKNYLEIIKPLKKNITKNEIKGKNNKLNQSIFNEISENMFRLDLTPRKWDLIKKIEKSTKKMEEICYISFGLQPGKLNKFVFNQYMDPDNLNENPKIMKRFIRGRNIKRYAINYTGDIVRYLPKELHRPAFPELFENPKIVISEISKDIKAAYDEEKYYGNEKTVQVIPWNQLKTLEKSVLMGRGINLTYELLENSKNYDLKYLLSLLNSKLINFFFKVMISDGLNVFPDNIRKIPIYEKKFNEQLSFIEKTDIMLQLNKDLQEEINSFHNWLHRTFKIEKFSKKLEKYYELNFDEFLKEVKKKKVDIKPRKTQELLENEFNESLAVIKPLLHEIEVTDREIDEMVYDLYGLTPEERQIVEDSLQ